MLQSSSLKILKGTFGTHNHNFFRNKNDYYWKYKELERNDDSYSLV
jgi:hypothetical protein